ncbi:MAG: hypothetical protein C0614_11610 [Desulfuromonas sp.]|nr:MAG: hypothetical protein C0614_11610 [Desulfuromonas sp.]
MLSSIARLFHRPNRQSAEGLCTLPVPLSLYEANRVLAFAPHPDDEVLGCGGTLSLLAKLCPVKVVLVTDGSGAGELPKGTAELRKSEFRQSLAVLGIEAFELWDLPDGAVTDSPDLGRRIATLLKNDSPDWVFAPSPSEYHRDHARIATAVDRQCRKCRHVEKLIFYEVWAPLQATHCVDVSSCWNQKMDALAKHATALRYGDYRAYMEGLNRYRSMYLPNCRYAEAFQVAKLR